MSKTNTRNDFIYSLKTPVPNNNELHDIIKDYKTRYTPLFKEILLLAHKGARKHLKEVYDINIVFDFSARIKSDPSIDEKIDRKIKEGKSGRVYDIFAMEISPFSVNGSTNEKSLVDCCYIIEDFFKNVFQDVMKEEFPTCTITTLDDKCKDYIKNPRPLYKALHIIQIYKFSESECFPIEMHFDTYRNKQICIDEHRKIYKDRGKILNQDNFRDYPPEYIEIIPNKNGIGNPDLSERTKEQDLEKYFGKNILKENSR